MRCNTGPLLGRPIPRLAVLAAVVLAAAGSFVYRGSGTPKRTESPTPPPIAGHWTLSFDDGFTGLNRRIWQPTLWWHGDTAWPTHQLQVYRPSSVTVDRGSLALTARRAARLVNWNRHSADSNGEPFSWTSGLVSSGGILGVAPIGFAQRYGYFEARIKMPERGAGFWPAFWLQGVNGSSDSRAASYDDGSEIDVVEVRSPQPNTVQMHLHGVVKFAAFYHSPSPLMGGGYHTYGVDWEPGHVAWFFDRRKVAEYNGRAVDKQPPHYIILDLAVGGAHAGAGAANHTTPSQATMRIAYVRVWRR